MYVPIFNVQSRGEEGAVLIVDKCAEKRDRYLMCSGRGEEKGDLLLYSTCCKKKDTCIFN